MEVAKVWKQKKNNVKLITIPKNSGIEEGDQVAYKKVVINEED